jgi:signal transduction histidine kinase
VTHILPAATANTTPITGLMVASLVLLGLSVLTGLLALVLRAAEIRKITLRTWLGLAWLATLLIPALAWALFTGGYTLLHNLQDTKTANTYALTPMQLSAAEIAVAVSAFLITALCVAWLTGHTVLRPLTAMRQAARQIAGGDLEIHLPDPPLREVAEVADAFDAMGTALRGSLERQAELEQQRRLVIGAVAHDLRTPLFSLRGLLEGLDNGVAATPEKVARYLALSRQQVDNMERLASDLFTYTRLDYLDEEPHWERLDLAALLGTVAECAQARAAENGITLVIQGTAACPVEGDAHLLRRAVDNVLDNALRHTPAGGTITVCYEHAGPACRFLVADSGPGIDPTDLPHIFDPLYRGEASRNRGSGGAGLGLAIARRILRAHGGELRSVNRSEGGAQFEGILPLPVAAWADAD